MLLYVKPTVLPWIVIVPLSFHVGIFLLKIWMLVTSLSSVLSFFSRPNPFTFLSFEVILHIFHFSATRHSHHSHTEADNHPQSTIYFLLNHSFEFVLMSCHSYSVASLWLLLWLCCSVEILRLWVSLFTNWSMSVWRTYAIFIDWDAWRGLWIITICCIQLQKQLLKSIVHYTVLCIEDSWYICDNLQTNTIHSLNLVSIIQCVRFWG